MKQNMSLKSLAVIAFTAISMQTQAQGIYVNKKNGESIPYPKAILDRVVPSTVTTNTGSSGDYTTQGAIATLQYDRIADMKTARIGHQIFPTTDGFVVVGGHTTNFQLTQTAEIYQNGQWKDLSISSPHDGSFCVTLNDGRVMVGGGFSSNAGVGQSKKVDIYNPSTQTFTPGPDLSVARAACKAIAIGGKVFVSGNWYADDKVLDYYDGTSFKSVGDMDGRSNPYLFTDSKNSVYALSAYGIRGGDFGFYTAEDGTKALSGDRYDTTDGKTYYYRFPFYAQWVPLWLHADAQVENASYIEDGKRYFVILAKQDEQYMLTETCPDEGKSYYYSKFVIPSKHPTTNASITYRGTVFMNATKREYYLIGTSGTSSNQTVHIISFNYSTGAWTIASANGFTHNLMEGAWTLLKNGRLACAGGSISSNYDAQKNAYLFTPPVAGSDGASSATAFGVRVYKNDGTHEDYLESELESITTYEEEFDQRITQEIPTQYLSKMSSYMPIYSGNTAVNFEGTYKISPYAVVYDETGNRSPGTVISDKIIKFSNQNISKGTVDLEEKQQSSLFNASDVVIMGQGDSFTAFFINTGTEEGITLKRASIISGAKTNEGLKNFYYGFIVLEKGPDPDKKLMEVGKCRIYRDSDGLSEPTSWNTRAKAAKNHSVTQSDCTFRPISLKSFETAIPDAAKE